MFTPIPQAEHHLHEYVLVPASQEVPDVPDPEVGFHLVEHQEPVAAEEIESRPLP